MATMQLDDICPAHVIAARRELDRRLSAEVKVLAAGGLCERELGELLRRLDEGCASDADRARLGECSLPTLRLVVEVLASV